MQIKFSDDATAATFAGVIGNGLIEWTVDIDHEDGSHDQVVILEVSEHNVLLCDSTETGAPIRDSKWSLPLDRLRSVTVL